MQLLTEALAPWRDFYELLGEAAATMIGLLFVAASVGAGVFQKSRRGALRIFLSASVAQFACVLATSLVVLAPFGRWEVMGGAVLACGVLGLAYSALVQRDALREGMIAKLGLEDRLWYAVAPAAGYLVEAAAGAGLILRWEGAPAFLAAAMGALAFAAIRNAWDITVWSVTRRET